MPAPSLTCAVALAKARFLSPLSLIVTVAAAGNPSSSQKRGCSRPPRKVSSNLVQVSLVMRMLMFWVVTPAAKAQGPALGGVILARHRAAVAGGVLHGRGTATAGTGNGDGQGRGAPRSPSPWRL